MPENCFRVYDLCGSSISPLTGADKLMTPIYDRYRILTSEPNDMILNNREREIGGSTDHPDHPHSSFFSLTCPV